MPPRLRGGRIHPTPLMVSLSNHMSGAPALSLSKNHPTASTKFLTQSGGLRPGVWTQSEGGRVGQARPLP